MSVPIRASFRTVDAVVPNELFVYGQVQVEFSANHVIKAGQNLAVGSVLGLATSGGDAGKLKLVTAAAVDGSQNPWGILTEPVDTSSTGTNADTGFSVAVSGTFNINALIVGAGITVTAPAFVEALRLRNLHVKALGFSG